VELTRWLGKRYGFGINSRNRDGQRFYKVSPAYATKYIWAYADESTGHEIGRLGLRELEGFKGTARFVAREGKVAADFIWNDLLLLIVSERVLRLFRDHKIKGYSLYRVAVTRDSEIISGYHGIAITGRGGPNDPKASAGGLMPGTKIKKVKGLFPTKWDGCDLFTLDDFPRAAPATERVKEIFEKNKVTNCKFRPAEEFQIGY